MYGMCTNEKIEQFVDMHIFCDVSLLPNALQNAHIHVRKIKLCLQISLSITSYVWNKILKPFHINVNHPFSQQYLHTQTNKTF